MSEFNMVMGATDKNPGVRMAFYQNPTDQEIEVSIGEAPGQPVNIYRAPPGGVVKGPYNYVEVFGRGGLTRVSDAIGQALQSKQDQVMRAVNALSPEEVEKLLSDAKVKADAKADADTKPPAPSPGSVVIGDKKAK